MVEQGGYHGHGTGTLSNGHNDVVTFRCNRRYYFAGIVAVESSVRFVYIATEMMHFQSKNFMVSLLLHKSKCTLVSLLK